LVSEKDDSFENYGSLYYKWDTEKKVILINTQGFDSFLREERGTVILSDLIPYNLGALGEHNPLDNKVMKNITESPKSELSVPYLPGTDKKTQGVLEKRCNPMSSGLDYEAWDTVETTFQKDLQFN
jgi:hypothetical protein